MINVLSVDEQVILAATAQMLSVMGVMNLANLPKTAPHKIPPSDKGDISAGHSPTHIPTTTEAATLEGTPHALLPATTAACAALQLMDAPISPTTVIPRNIDKDLSQGKSSNTQDTQPHINTTAKKDSPSDSSSDSDSDSDPLKY